MVSLRYIGYTWYKTEVLRVPFQTLAAPTSSSQRLLHAPVSRCFLILVLLSQCSFFFFFFHSIRSKVVSSVWRHSFVYFFDVSSLHLVHLSLFYCRTCSHNMVSVTVFFFMVRRYDLSALSFVKSALFGDQSIYH